MTTKLRKLFAVCVVTGVYFSEGMGWGRGCAWAKVSAVKFVAVLLFDWLNSLKQRERAEKQSLYNIHGDDEALI